MFYISIMKEAMAKCKAKKKMKLIILLFLIIQKEIVQILERENSFLVEKKMLLQKQESFRKKNEINHSPPCICYCSKRNFPKKKKIWRQES